MPTGSFPIGNVLQFSSQSLNLNNGRMTRYNLTYPVGYSENGPVEFTSTGSAATGTIISPTIGQIFPRGY